MENEENVSVAKLTWRTVKENFVRSIGIVAVYYLIFIVTAFAWMVCLYVVDETLWESEIIEKTIGYVVSFLTLPFAYGLSVFYLHVVRRDNPKLSMLFYGLDDFKRIAGTQYLRGLYIALWSLLLIIPGIIRHYGYAMTPFLLHDEPDLKYGQALERSKQMMEGHKAELFGWHFFLSMSVGVFSGFVLLLLVLVMIAFKNVVTIALLVVGVIGVYMLMEMLNNALYATFYERLKNTPTVNE